MTLVSHCNSWKKLVVCSNPELNWLYFGIILSEIQNRSNCLIFRNKYKMQVMGFQSKT